MSLSKNVLFVAISIFSTANFAADLYVSANNGSDANVGSASAPVKTIQKAAGLAKAGTTVHVADGVYTGNVTNNASGTSSARVRYVSDTKWGAKIIGTGTEFHWINNGSYVDIIGFDISGPGRGGILNSGSFTLVARNHVHNLAVSGGCTGSGGAGIVDANYSASDDDIIGNVVHDIGIPGACNGVQGIYHSNLRGHIYNNIVFRVSAFGIHLWHAANNVIIMNNTVFANGSSTMGGGIVIGSGDSPGGIVIDNTRIANNIVYNNPAGGILEYCYSGVNCVGSNNSIESNLVYGNRIAFSLLVGAATRTIAADPQFVNYAPSMSGDFHLQSTSPAIAAGSSTSGLATDIDGNPRVGTYDIGAYAYISATPVPEPVPTPPPPVAAPKATVSTTALRFASRIVGTTSLIKLVTITNTGTAAMKIPAAFVMTGDFAFGGTGTCSVSASYAPGASCTASVVFKPKAKGLRVGSLSMVTNASAIPIVVKLSGYGK